ncbi:probable protein phosphatase 2C 43 [Medicago truncatula]|uniref:protein-serine/threonine phosphatase n=1 Tax=Medicago truncatula TaxID=3880 RepID=G7KRR3_MEDTR|nr:probable protein phosphatase 2C 43 [Medicago truncatula]AES81282.2 catalytic/protein phosphatase type 2C [Medicago truncatula]
MHPWLENIVNLCRKRKNDNINMALFDQDPHASSIDLKRHCYGQFSSAFVQANEAMEDHSQVEVASRKALFLGVYDGHAGFEASVFITQHLFDHLLRAVRANENKITEPTLRDAVSATEAGFLEYVEKNYRQKNNLGKVGSCCLAGIIWKKTLHVANLGDSRAVIGTMVNNKIQAEQLTRDHNCKDEAIRKELMSEHPDDTTIVMYEREVWRVKGIITVSRSIGDTYLKRPEFSLDESFPKFEEVPEPFIRGVLSAEPEMRSRDLTENDKFLIFASDGLWDFLSNEQAVEIVQNNSRNICGIAKRLVSTVLAQAAANRNSTYNTMKNANLGRGDGNRRYFHDDISVIVVFLDKKSILRMPLHNLSYKSSSARPTTSAFAESGLTMHGLQRLQKTIKNRFQASSSQEGESSQTQDPEGESSQTQSLLGQSSRAAKEKIYE